MAVGGRGSSAKASFCSLLLTGRILFITRANLVLNVIVTESKNKGI